MHLYACSSQVGKAVTVAIDMVTETMDEDNDSNGVGSGLSH